MKKKLKIKKVKNLCGKKPRSAFYGTKVRGNFSGAIVGPGSGESQYRHGILVYCSDGKGNEYFEGDEEDTDGAS